MKFWLGVHRPGWLASAGVPLFVSHRALRGVKTLPRAVAEWCLDSGGFTELHLHGRFTVTPPEYIAAAERYSSEIGRLAWIAPQDWMCEPFMVARTGLTVAAHQDLTVANFCDLRDRARTVHVIPVLQGWQMADYRRCFELYDRAGVNLRAESVVGLGSVCRRQSTEEIGEITAELAYLGVNLHGFGVKSAGLARYASSLTSADSMAWSLGARRSDPLPGHTHKSCSNCLDYALAWRTRTVRLLDHQQMRLPISLMEGMPV